MKKYQAKLHKTKADRYFVSVSLFGSWVLGVLFLYCCYIKKDQQFEADVMGLISKESFQDTWPS